MAVDIETLKEIILELAEIKTSSTDAATQLTWVRQTFVPHGDDALAGGFNATTLSETGASFQGVWNGASSFERAAAMKAAIDHLKSVVVNGAALPQIRRLDFSGSNTLG